MSRKLTVVLTGDKELNAKLAALTGKQAKEAIRKAARPALQVTLQAARSLAPIRSGSLRRSLKIRTIRRSRTRVGMRLTTSKSDNQYSGKTFYAAFQEWGWKTGSRKSKNRRQIAATNFLKQAAISTRSQALKIYASKILEHIRNTVKS
jgi:HK97 gp10 family phage protein